MRKAEMTDNQLQNRTTIIEVLSHAGWIGRETNKLFEEGWWFDAEAVMDYQSNEVGLILQYCAEDNSIDFSINEGSKGLDFIIKIKDNLSEILSIIISFQESISLKNYKQYIRKILNTGQMVYIILNDEPVEISDKKLKLNTTGSIHFWQIDFFRPTI
jgi:hypothetical protein